MTGEDMQNDNSSLWAVLGVERGANEVEIKRAYRNLVSKHHPDKPSGDADLFREIQHAYSVLSDPSKRQQYAASGTWQQTAEDEFMEAFAGGTFRDHVRATKQQAPRIVLTELALVQEKQSQSHSAGFEAWLRSRGEGGTRVYTAEDVMNQFGVVKSSYEAVPLPRIQAHTVVCNKLGAPKEVLRIEHELLPSELEWGQVLVSIRAAPISPADLYTVQTGSYGQEAAELPFTPGICGVGIVVKLGPGCKTVVENDWVVPLASMGCWRTLLVAKEKDLLRVPANCMPLEQLACLREQLTAYQLLEECGLKPGDAIVLNAANSCVGQYVLQLCSILRLRAIAVVDGQRNDMDKLHNWLTSLGATHVLPDAGSLRLALEKYKFFAKPKVALDAVGGQSAARLVDALADGGTLLTYGVMSGRSPTFQWRDWLFGGLQVRGFSLARWIKENRKKVPDVLDSLARLVNAGKLKAATTEYELATEFEEALDHAMARHKDVKVVLTVTDVGERV